MTLIQLERTRTQCCSARSGSWIMPSPCCGRGQLTQGGRSCTAPKSSLALDRALRDGGLRPHLLVVARLLRSAMIDTSLTQQQSLLMMNRQVVTTLFSRCRSASLNRSRSSTLHLPVTQSERRLRVQQWSGQQVAIGLLALQRPY